jgi:hypothetical protein
MRASLAVLMIAIGSVSGPTLTIQPAQAQTTMLVPGVYTTPDISRRCQSYARARVRTDGMDNARQSVFLACVRRLSSQQGGPGTGYAAGPAYAPGPAYATGPMQQDPLVEAPVGMPFYGPIVYGPYRGGCVTDEGYGRTGSCDTDRQ